jgi:hypothetical protein
MVQELFANVIEDIILFGRAQAETILVEAVNQLILEKNAFQHDFKYVSKNEVNDEMFSID